MTRLVGSSQADAFAGLWQNDQLYGRGGDDHIEGGDGNDRIYGEPGNDYLQGDGGSDQLYGGGGDDILADNWGDNAILHGGAGDDHLYGMTGELYGDAGNDTVTNYGQQDVAVTGGRGADSLDLQLDGEGAFYGGHHTVEVKDLNLGEGDQLNLDAYDGYGNWFDGSTVRSAFDDNHDGKLNAADTYVDTDAAGDGMVLHWWGMDLHLDHVQELAVTPASTDFVM